MAKRNKENYSALFIIKERQIKITRYLTPVRLAHFTKNNKQSKTTVGRDVGGKEPLLPSGGNVHWSELFVKYRLFSKSGKDPSLQEQMTG